MFDNVTKSRNLLLWVFLI